MVYKSFYTILLMVGMFAGVLYAQSTYTAPKVKQQKKSFKWKGSAKNEKLDSEMNYRVQENPNKDRDIASGDEEEKEVSHRFPSSGEKPRKSNKKVKSWKYKQEVEE